jgi:SPP1 gp7 family putative phage head morphogenesis protein
MQTSSQIKVVELKPLRDNDKDYEEIERRIRALFKQEIFLPLLRLLGVTGSVLQNAILKNALLDAIRTGRIQFYRGVFSGKLNASITRDLKALGATWERKTGTFKLPSSSLTAEVRHAISASESSFRQKLSSIDQKLAQILPEEIADKLHVGNHIDQTIWKVEKEFSGSLRNITLTPTLSKEARARLAEEWQNNLRLDIKTWTQKEVVNLRKAMQASVFAGNRNDTAVKLIMKSHDVSVNKAKFLARQETRLLLTKYKQTRYEDAGVNEYRWGIANRPIQSSRSAPYIKGQVRHDHGMLAGKTFRWDHPPITNTLTGARNNPGQDYNCRCYAIPIVKFKTGETK